MTPTPIQVDAPMTRSSAFHEDYLLFWSDYLFYLVSSFSIGWSGPWGQRQYLPVSWSPGPESKICHLKPLVNSVTLNKLLPTNGPQFSPLKLRVSQRLGLVYTTTIVGTLLDEVTRGRDCRLTTKLDAGDRGPLTLLSEEGALCPPFLQGELFRGCILQELRCHETTRTVYVTTEPHQGLCINSHYSGRQSRDLLHISWCPRPVLVKTRHVPPWSGLLSWFLFALRVPGQLANQHTWFNY